MKKNYLKTGLVRSFIFVTATFLLIVFGFIQPHASEKLVKNTNLNAKSKNKFTGLSPILRNNNTLPDNILSKLIDQQEKLQQLMQYPQSFNSPFSSGHFPLYPLNKSSAHIKGSKKALDPTSLNALRSLQRVSSKEPSYKPNEVLVKFQWPGVIYKGQKASLIFVPKLSNGAMHPFYWKYVYIQ